MKGRETRRDQERADSKASPVSGPHRAPAAPAGKEMPDARRGGAARSASDEPAGGDLDLSLDEIEPTKHLKEGFTGQER
jgi:hypothetical protein